MKRLLLSLAALAATGGFATAAEYTVFRICEDQHVLKTSDGADAGHVEYIVVDPAEHRVVSTIVTGGVLADRTVAVPITAFRFGGQREVVLTEITRERLVSAPVIESTHITSIRSGRFDPVIVERSNGYFRGGVNVNVNSRTTVREGDRSRTNVDVNARDGRDTARGTAREGDRKMRRGEGADRTGTEADRNPARTPRDGQNADQPDANDRTGKAGKAGKAGARGESSSNDPATSTDANRSSSKSDANREGSSRSTTKGKSGKGSTSKSGDDADRPSSNSEKSGSDKASSDKASSGKSDRSSGKAETAPPASSGKAESSSTPPSGKSAPATDSSGSSKSGKSDSGSSTKSGSGTSGKSGSSPREGATGGSAPSAPDTNTKKQ